MNGATVDEDLLKDLAVAFKPARQPQPRPRQEQQQQPQVQPQQTNVNASNAHQKPEDKEEQVHDDDDVLVCDAVNEADRDGHGGGGNGGGGCCGRDKRPACIRKTIKAWRNLRKGKSPLDLEQIMRESDVVGRRGVALLKTAAGVGPDMGGAGGINNNNVEVDENGETVITVIERLEEDIKKQTRDEYSYRYLELRNGLKLLLASNPNANSSAAALDIRVGSFHDPGHLQGLSHLCEHVLFTGSELFPSESYSSFLAQRGGSSNAYTTSEHTNFHFEVPSQHFVEALKRFVSFFRCPILRESCIQNELEIIQSEHEKNRFNDVWRTNQVERFTANSNHVFSRFSTGTRQTLTVAKGAERSLRYELFQFFKINYSANIMCLSLVHSQSLDEMEELAKELLLSLPNKNVPERIWPNRPFKNSQMRVKIYVVPVKDVYHVNLTFPLEDISMHYMAAPGGYVAQLIGHKGQGGLFSYLRDQGLAHHVVASSKTLAKGFSFFMISVQLTEDGERHVDRVVKHVFQYIKMLRDQGPLRWFFEELSHISNMQFETKDVDRPQNYASTIAQSLHLYKPEDVLAGDYVISEWRPDLIDLVYAYLSPENVRITVLTKKARFFATNVEPHFGTEYHVEKIPPDTIKEWKFCEANPELKAVKPNEFLDKNPRLITPDAMRESGMPELFLYMERIRMRSWFMPSTRLKLNKAYAFIKMSYPRMPQWRNAREACLANLLVFLARDKLAEVSYCAQLGGLFYTLKASLYGLELEVRGASGKMHVFLGKILEALYSMSTDEDQFKRVHDLHINGLKSAGANPLKSQAKNILSYLLTSGNHMQDERLAAMATVSLGDVRDFATDFFLNANVETFFFGNLDLAMADQLSSMCIESRKSFLEEQHQQASQELLDNAEDRNNHHHNHQQVLDEDQELTQGLHLEEWFRNDPVNRIVFLEKAVVKDLEARAALKAETANQLVDTNSNFSKSAAIVPTDDNNHVTDTTNGDQHQYVTDVVDHAEVAPPDPTPIPIQDPEEAEEEVVDETLFNMEFVVSSGSSDNGIAKNIVIVDNEVQSSSCVLFYLQCEKNLPEFSCKLELFYHLVREKLVTAMKTVVPLGYVVHCDLRKANGSLGFRITLESQYPLTVVHDSIEQAIDDLDDFLANFPEETFQMSKAAVVSVKKEMLASMLDHAQALWREIREETFNFDRHKQEVECIEKLELLDIRSFYRARIYSRGEERRPLVISIGPDPILNRLDDHPEIKHWTLDKKDVLKKEAFAPLGKHKVPNEWFSQVFESTTNRYRAPPF